MIISNLREAKCGIFLSIAFIVFFIMTYQTENLTTALISEISALGVALWLMMDGVTQKRNVWIWFYISVILYVMGSILDYGETLRMMSVTASSFFYAGECLTCLTGVMMYILDKGVEIISWRTLDVGVAVIASVSIMLGIFEPNISEVHHYILLFYLTLDILCFAGILLVILGPEQVNMQSGIMATSFFLMLVSDQLYFMQAEYSYEFDVPISLTAVASYIMLGLAATYESMRRETEKKKSPVWQYVSVVAPYAIVVVLFGGAAYHYGITTPVFLGAFLPMMLFGVRQIVWAINNKEIEDKLQKLNGILANDPEKDPLTQVNNRVGLKNAFEKITPATEELEDIGVLIMDIDKFRKVNNLHGCEAGDIVLKEVARILRDSVRGSDAIGRYGGDEFIVILPGADGTTVGIVAERIRNNMNVRWGLKDLKVTLSIGGASYRGGRTLFDPEALVAFADKALYRAKKEGRDRYCMYEPE